MRMWGKRNGLNEHVNFQWTRGQTTWQVSEPLGRKPPDTSESELPRIQAHGKVLTRINVGYPYSRPHSEHSTYENHVIFVLVALRVTRTRQWTGATQKTRRRQPRHSEDKGSSEGRSYASTQPMLTMELASMKKVRTTAIRKKRSSRSYCNS